MALLQSEDVLKLRALRLHIKAGIDELDRSDFDEVDEGDLEAYLETLTRVRTKTRAEGGGEAQELGC